MIWKNSKILPSSSLVTRYIYVLVSIILVFALIIFAIFKQQSESYAEQTLKTHNFYLVGNNLTTKIKDNIGRARISLLQQTNNQQRNEKSPIQHGLYDRDIIKNILIELQEHNQQLQDLHNKYDDPIFITLVEKIDRAINQEDSQHILEEHSDEQSEDKSFEDHLKSIYIIAHQLERLYTRKLEELNSTKTTASGSLTIQQKAIILFLALITITFVSLIVRAIKHIGQEQNSTNHQLNKFKATLDSTNDCVFMFTSDTLKFTYCNDGAIKQIGYAPDEIASMQPFDIKPHFNEAQFRDLIEPMKNDGNNFIAFETVHQHKDGHTLPVEIGLQYIHPENEEPHFLAIVRDITERKTTENQLREYQQQLEELVDERTQELRNAQDELVRKERLATLGNLTATVSHELRNPLGSMRPSLYVIETVTRDNNNEKLQAAVQRLYRSIDRCDGIIDELLDFTRITDLSLQTIILDEWLDEVIQEQPLLNGIELIYQPHLDNAQIHIDADRFRRAIINVFENACHAMLIADSMTEVIDNAKLSIHTQVKNDRVNISISDSGGGIPDEVMEKIFEPLFSTKGFGVGLGMPTVQQIMKQHKGGIDIDTSSKGTTVTLWLPLET